MEHLHVCILFPSALFSSFTLSMQAPPDVAVPLRVVVDILRNASATHNRFPEADGPIVPDELLVEHVRLLDRVQELEERLRQYQCMACGASRLRRFASASALGHN
jgi:hypothetical protein